MIIQYVKYFIHVSKYKLYNNNIFKNLKNKINILTKKCAKNEGILFAFKSILPCTAKNKIFLHATFRDKHQT